MDVQILALHGSRSEASYFNPLKNALEKEGIDLYAITGPIRDFQGFSWYHDPSEMAKAVAYVHQVIQQAKLDPAKLVLLGFSQGAGIALEYIIRVGPLAGVIALAGRIEEVPVYLRKPPTTPILWLHGLHDKLLSCEIAQAQAERLQEAGVPLSFYIIDAAHELPVEQQLPFMLPWLAGLKPS